MALDLKARRYIAAAVEEFGGVKQRGDWAEWDHRSTDGDAPLTVCAIALKVLSLKADMLDGATSEEKESRLSDVIADLGFLQSLIRSLKNVPP